MRKIYLLLGLLLAGTSMSLAQAGTVLRLKASIPVPGVARKWDHFGVDLKSNRLFVTSEEDPAVEVFDLRTNAHLKTLADFKEPHNVVVFPATKKIFVVDGGASEIKVLDYNSYQLVGHIPLTIDADPYAFDPATKYMYVVNGGREAHTPYCLISVVDTASEKKLADLKLPTNRLESMALDPGSSRLFVNMTGVNQIGIVDRKSRELLQTWPVTAGQQNVPMKYDAAAHRIFVATRNPSRLVVVNADTGKEVATIPVADYVDDLAYDASHHRLFIPGGGGNGAISVVEQRGPDDYQVVATVPTKPGAKTAFFLPELNRYYVGVPSSKTGQQAEIFVFDVAH